MLHRGYMGLHWVTLRLHWRYNGDTLGLHWGYISVILRLHWGYLWVTLGLHWDNRCYIGVTLG